jgi:hypothetical protein
MYLIDTYNVYCKMDMQCVFQATKNKGQQPTQKINQLTNNISQ